MRLLIATDYFPPHWGGGVERVVYEQARRLVQRGLAVDIFTLDTRRGPRREYLHGIGVSRVPARSLSSLLRVESAVTWGAWGHLRGLLRTSPPDLIHVHGLFGVTGALAALAAVRREIPLVTTLHLGALDALSGPLARTARLLERTLGRWLLSHSALVVAVGEAVGVHARALGVTPGRVRVIPNRIEAPPHHLWTTRRPTVDRPVRVVFLGRLIGNKGPHHFVEMALRLAPRFPSLEFLLIGDGPLRTRLDRTVRARGMAHRVRFLGFRTDVLRLLRTVDVLVRPSLTEGLPLAVLEAMAMGIPVVATRTGGSAELVRDGETGRLVPPGDVGALAAAVAELVGNPARRAAMGEAALRRSQPYQGWEVAVDELLEAYRDVLGERGAPVPVEVAV